VTSSWFFIRQLLFCCVWACAAGYWTDDREIGLRVLPETRVLSTPQSPQGSCRCYL